MVDPGHYIQIDQNLSNRPHKETKVTQQEYYGESIILTNARNNADSNTSFLILVCMRRESCRSRKTQRQVWRAKQSWVLSVSTRPATNSTLGLGRDILQKSSPSSRFTILTRSRKSRGEVMSYATKGKGDLPFPPTEIPDLRNLPVLWGPGIFLCTFSS